MNYCAIIPTYNNDRTLGTVIEKVLQTVSHVIVVNDGSTDNTAALLEHYADNNHVTVIGYPRNRGKGYALRTGLENARAMNFDYAVTIDSDGQHYAEDIPHLMATLEKQLPCTKVMVVGSRDLQAEGMPTKNTFANRFSNFWFLLQTGIRLPDTQTGFRIYPLHHLPNLRLLTYRYESELELLVYSAWRNVRLIPANVRVYYPPQGERVTHFRPFADFARISILNTFLCFAAILYGYPSMMLRRITENTTNNR